jgi:trafficking protein particle complex subunit 9
MVRSTSGTIHVSYSYAHRSTGAEPNVFHTRQLSYPLMVTVYHMLECHGMDLLPFPSYSPPNSAQESQGNGDDNADWCLFTIDVRNTYGSPFEVSIERVQKGTVYLSPLNLATHESRCSFCSNDHYSTTRVHFQV